MSNDQNVGLSEAIDNSNLLGGNCCQNEVKEAPLGSFERQKQVFEAAAKSAQKLPNSDYIEADISDEEYREITYIEFGETMRIENPQKLIIRKGGKTHRVVDSKGGVHLYPAPEGGKTYIYWKNRDAEVPVQF